MFVINSYNDIESFELKIVKITHISWLEIQKVLENINVQVNLNSSEETKENLII